jgi:hypothetical protein
MKGPLLETDDASPTGTINNKPNYLCGFASYLFMTS